MQSTLTVDGFLNLVIGDFYAEKIINQAVVWNVVKILNDFLKSKS